MFRKKQKGIVRILFGLAILLFLFYKVGFKSIGLALKDLDLKYMPLILFLFILSWFIAMLNLKILFKPLKLEIANKRLFKYFMLSKAISLIFPGRIGEFSIVLFLKKHGISIGESTAVVFLDKLITIIVSSIFGFLGIFFFFGKLYMIRLLLLFVLAIFLLFIFLKEKSRQIIRKHILRRYASKFKGFSKTLFSYRKQKRLILYDSFLTLLRIFLNVVAAFFIFLAFGKNINLFVLFLVSCIETLTTIIPLTTNGLGIRQGIGIYILSSFYGLESSIIAARYVIGILINYFLSLFSVIFFWKKER